MKRLISKLYLVMLVVMLTMSFSTTVFATDLDSLNSGQSTNSTDTNQSSGASDSHNDSVSDYLQGYNPVTNENMASASEFTTPITNAIGMLVGAGVMLVSALIFLVTVLDLFYIAIPFTRGLLNPQPQGGGMQGGMGMMGGGAQQPAEQGLRRRWVSDEALACVAQGNPQPQGGGMSPMGGMGGMGMSGGMGGMGMGMGMQGGGQQPMPTKSVILMYLKKRVFFLVIFAVATILLTSSIFTDCGINLAELSFKIIDKFNSMISGVSV